jgi:hypothetical protein
VQCSVVHVKQEHQKCQFQDGAIQQEAQFSVYRSSSSILYRALTWVKPVVFFAQITHKHTCLQLVSVSNRPSNPVHIHTNVRQVQANCEHVCDVRCAQKIVSLILQVQVQEGAFTSRRGP